ncbi:MAG: FHA domain-containing protein [Myxococcota bacterium]
MRGLRGPHAHAIYVLESESTVFGRAATADVQVLDQRVSRQHARLQLRDGTATIEDLRSHNGTLVNGEPIAQRQTLRPGDRLCIGVAEYAFDELKQRVLTSAVFLNKLTTRETLGATIVRRVAKEILSSPTAEMPSQTLGQVPPRPAQEITARAPGSLRREPAPAREPAYLAEARARAIEVPPAHPDDPKAKAPVEATKTPARKDDLPPPPVISFEPEPPAAPGLPEIDVPELGDLLRKQYGTQETPAADVEFATEPLDPRTQRVHTPVPTNTADVIPPGTVAKPDDATLHDGPKIQPPVAAPEHSQPDQAGFEAAMRTVDAVVRLLRLRNREGDGAPLKIHDRERLRKLESALRESRRNSANRRRWTRLPCRLAAQVGDAHDTARVVDIGAGGLRIVGSELPLVPGDPITVRVLLGEGRLARVAVFSCKVAWVDATESSFGAVFAGPARWELAG